MHRMVGGVLASLCVLLLVACAPSSDGAAPVRLPGGSDLVRPVWSTRVALVGEPVVREGVVASYVRGGATGLEVRAWSLLDGRELWRSAALVGRAPQGVEVSLGRVRSDGVEHVTFLAPSEDWRPSELVVAALATGVRKRVERPAVAVTARPDACGEDVCFTGWALGTQRLEEPARQLRLAVGSGRIRFDDARPVPAGSIAIGEDLFVEQGAHGVPELVRVVDATTRWRRTYASVFGAGATTAGGWAWRRVGPLLIGVGGSAGVVRGGAYRSDLGATSAVALDAATGRLRWRIRGAATCRDTDLGAAYRGRTLELCRYRGSPSAPDRPHATAADVTYTGARVTRIGVDAATGEVRWSQALVAAAALASGPSPVPSARWRPVLTAHGMQVQDRATGRITSAAPGTVVACATTREPLRTGSEDPGDYAAGTSVGPCSGRRWSRFAVMSAGIDAGNGRRVVLGAHTLAMFRL